MENENNNSVNTEEVATSVNNSAESTLDDLLVIDDNEIVEENEVGADNQEEKEKTETPINFNSEEQSKNKNNEANSEFARMRRENAELKKQNEIASKYLANLYKEQGINDVEAFNNYMQTFEKKQKDAEYKERFGFGVDEIDKIVADRINSNPELQQFKKIQEQRKVELEVQEFESAYPQFKDVKQIQDLPNYEKVLEFRNKHNLSLTDAFTIANKDKLKELQQEDVIKMKNNIKTDLVAKQNKNISNISGSIKSNPITITKSEMSEWKKFFPNKSEDDLKKIIYKNKTR